MADPMQHEDQQHKHDEQQQQKQQHHPLPSTRAFVTSLLHSLAPVSEANTSLPTKTRGELDSHAKDLLLALHALLPAYVLDALDVLDRGLVTRLVVDDDDDEQLPRTEWYVESTRSLHNPWKGAAAAASQADREATIVRYHVRLAAWHCSCPGFAHATFGEAAMLGKASSGASVAGDGHDDDDNDNDHGDEDDDMSNANFSAALAGKLPFGGLLGQNKRGLPPACKHLVACALAHAARPLFDGFAAASSTARAGVKGVAEVHTTKAGAAGWAAQRGYG